jgi:hypothetical protein
MEVCAAKAILHIRVLIYFYPYFLTGLSAVGCVEAIHGAAEKIQAS